MNVPRQCARGTRVGRRLHACEMRGERTLEKAQHSRLIIEDENGVARVRRGPVVACEVGPSLLEWLGCHGLSSCALVAGARACATRQRSIIKGVTRCGFGET